MSDSAPAIRAECTWRNPQPGRTGQLSAAVVHTGEERTVLALCDAAGDFGTGPEATEPVAEFLATLLHTVHSEAQLVAAFQQTTQQLGPRFVDDLGIHGSWSTAAAVFDSHTATLAWAGATGAAHLRDGQVLWRSKPHLLLPDMPEGLPLRTVVGRLQGDPRAWAPPQTRVLTLQPDDTVLVYTRSVEKLFWELQSDSILLEEHPVPLVDRLAALAQWPPSVVEVRAVG